MILPTDQFAKIVGLHADSALLTEGGLPLILLNAFPLKASGQDTCMTLLLCPRTHSGYSTRLFFERQISGRGQNWTQHHLVGRSWWTPSWNYVRADLPWTAILGEHLRVVQ